MNKAVLINIDDEFATLSEYLEENHVNNESIAAHECFIVVDKQVEFWSRGRRISIDDSYVFIRSWSKGEDRNKHLVSLFAEYCHQKCIPYSSEIFRYDEKSSSKITQAIKFSTNNIAHPFTIIASKESYFVNEKDILSKIQFPCVFKRSGSSGNVVWKIDNEIHLKEKVSKSKDNLFVIQEYVPNEYDIRVLVFESKVLGAIKRISVDGFYNNYARGGSVEKYMLSEEEKAIALKAASVAGLNFAGVDLVVKDREPIVLEVNRKPGITGYKEAHGYDVVEDVARIIYEKNGE